MNHPSIFNENNGPSRSIEQYKRGDLYGTRIQSAQVLAWLRATTMSLVLPTSNEGGNLGQKSSGRGPFPINRGSRRPFPDFCHLLGAPSDQSRPQGIQGYHISIDNEGSIGLLELEKHLPLVRHDGKPFQLRLNIAPTKIESEEVATVDYVSNDPNTVIDPDYPGQTAQVIGQLVVVRAVNTLIQISDKLRYVPERQPTNPFHHARLQALYNNIFPADGLTKPTTS
jgi:hypothetical protein